MNERKRWLAAGAIGFILNLIGSCPAVWAQDQPIIFSATGDLPYSSSQMATFQQQLADHNQYSPAEFFVHLGDIMGSSSLCTEPEYSSVADALKMLAVPAFVVPGDNEYNDCPNPAQGWTYWEQYFTDFERNFCGVPAALERQSVRHENFAFVSKGVLFIGINLVGGSVHDQSEWNTRMQDDADWVSLQFQARVTEVRAAVVFAQAGPDSKRDLFFNQFIPVAATFGQPVLFMHGDGHSWIQDYPFPAAPNVLRVQVDNGAAEDPLEVTVTTDPQNIFSLKRDPWANNPVVYNMPPCVNAGPDQTITLPTLASLSGQATDDGDPNPPAALATTWSVVSGPGAVSFDDANSPVTLASFSAPGTYVLQLTANDGQLQSSDDMTIIVGDGNPFAPSISSFTPSAGLSGSEVTITGSNFTDATQVTFNGATASFAVDSDTQIRANVPASATGGKIAVTTPDGVGVSADNFTIQYSLSVSTVGSGSVTANPGGGIYNAGAAVILTATPGTGFQFAGWSGDLAGSSNPATISMNANKSVTATFVVSSSQVTHKETKTGAASSITVTTSASLTGVNGDFYLAAIAAKPNIAVSSVAGLGLTWTRVKAQCSGRNNSGMEVWMARGTPSGNGSVTATLAATPSNAVIAVSRYAGVDATNPLGNVISGNTKGLDGLCAGGVNSSAYSFNLTTMTNGAMVYGAAAMRGRRHTPGAGYTERAEIQKGSSGSIASIAVEDKTAPLAGATVVNGTFSGTVDWAVIALEIKPSVALGKSSLSAAEENLATPPAAYVLEQNYPNPFWSEAASSAFGGGNLSTAINFSLPEAGKVTINVYNQTGQLVRTLVDDEMAAGRQELRWHGRNQAGEAVAAGIYLYQIVVRGRDGGTVFMQTRRMTLLK